MKRGGVQGSVELYSGGGTAISFSFLATYGCLGLGLALVTKTCDFFPRVIAMLWFVVYRGGCRCAGVTEKW
jgi:hypothetical protein